MSTTKANGSNLPTVFSYGKNKLTSVVLDGEPLFLVKEICSILELSHTHKAVKSLDDDERKIIPGVDLKGRKNQMLAVNESGLYNLIFRSNKPEAKQFRRWVTNEVLPALRKQGSYQLKPPAPMQVQPVPDIFTKLKQEFNEKVRTIVINGTTYYKAFDIKELVYNTSFGGYGGHNIMGKAINKAIKEGDAVTIFQKPAHVYWINYYVVKEILEKAQTRKAMLLHMALFEQGEPLPAPVLPESQVRVVINKLLKGREHGCTI